MTDPDQVRRLLRILGVYPVLPPAEALPADSDEFRALVADLALGERSRHVELVREAAADLVIAPEELARRAQFLMACLVLPSSGTHYEVLGVPRDATSQEIRKRWAQLIQRYHPDHVAGGRTNWLDEQARRIIDAYHTLGHPERRRRYDEELATERGRGSPRPVCQPTELQQLRLVPSPRWRWAPAAILVGGAVVATWTYLSPAPRTLPSAPLPPAPKLLEGRGTVDSERSGASTPSFRASARQSEPASRSAGREGGQAELSSAASRAVDLVERAVPASPPRATAASDATGEESDARERIRISQVQPWGPDRHRPAGTASQTTPMPPSDASVPSRFPRERSAPTIAPSSQLLAGSPDPAPPAVQFPNRSVPRPPVPPAADAATPVPPTSRVAGAVRPQASPSGPATPVPVATIPPRPATEPLALIESFRIAYERKDLSSLVGLFSTNVREWQAEGRPAVEQLYARNFAALGEIRYDLSDLEVMPSAANGHVLVRGSYRIRTVHMGPPPRLLDVAGPIRWLLIVESGVLRIVVIDYELPR